MKLPHIFSSARLQAELNALNDSQAVIEFNMDGTIITANENFLSTVGYTLDEIKGKHHSLFVEAAYKISADYKLFWEELNRGVFQSAEYKRIGKGGKEVWIQASYNPILGTNGKPFKVVKYATEISKQKLVNADYLGQISAIKKSQAVIEFNMDGTILDANENFLNTVGYTLGEIKGKHHSIFVEPVFRSSQEYKSFWEDLNRGEFQAAEYKRIGKGGKEVWIQASYNPIFDLNNKPFKVVKYATDITKQIQLLDQVKKLIDNNIGQIDRAVQSANEQAMAGASAATQTSQNVNAVASGAEELSASVREIAESMAKSRSAAESAFEQTAAADQSTQRLTETATAMGGVVDVIRNIAGQINLLALNATIEAARAGEAGKGFAVVAAEVKNLSRQATEATEQISKEIHGMQSVSSDVVNALSGIKTSIESLKGYVTSTAGAVEEQSMVAREMSSNMQSAADAVTTISQNINEIASAIELTDGALKETKEAALVLAR